MKHFRTEENQQNRPFKKLGVLDKISAKERGKIINNLVIDVIMFVNYNCLIYFFFTGCKVVVQIPIFPEEIEQIILDYERDLLMKDHYQKYKHVVKDIKEGLKIILVDRDWYKKYYRAIDDVFHFNFVWKVSSWTQQPLEGAALYIGRKRIVCSKRVPEIVKGWNNTRRHPYYRTKYPDECNYEKPTRQEAKLINHEYFHR